MGLRLPRSTSTDRNEFVVENPRFRCGQPAGSPSAIPDRLRASPSDIGDRPERTGQSVSAEVRRLGRGHLVALDEHIWGKGASSPNSKLWSASGQLDGGRLDARGNSTADPVVVEAVGPPRSGARELHAGNPRHGPNQRVDGVGRVGGDQGCKTSRVIPIRCNAFGSSQVHGNRSGVSHLQLLAGSVETFGALTVDNEANAFQQ